MINTNFNSILDLIKAFPNEQTCINHLTELRWEGFVISPFDADSKVYKCKNNRYKCVNTGKYFNVKTGTLFDNTKIELQKWFLAIWLVTAHKKGISSLQLSRDIDVTQKTAWFMLQRIRKCFGIENDNDLDNTVEIDETYIGGKNKNKHSQNKVVKSQGRNAKDKVPVMGMVERKGKLNAYKINSAKSNDLLPKILENVKETALICTDEWGGYNDLSEFYMYKHSKVIHSFNQYVDGEVHTNTIEGFWSLLKRGILGIYHFVSKKHLQNYIDEFVFRYNTRKHNQTDRLNLLLSNMEVRTTYKELISAKQ